MLQNIREKKWIAFAILVPVIITMAFFGIDSYFSTRIDTYAAKIEGPAKFGFWGAQTREISQDEFRRRYEQTRQQERERQGEAFDSEAFESLDNKREVLDAMVDEALLGRVAERDGALAGFLIGFGAHARHDSSNFAWFGERYPDFFYIDRVAVASRRRGGGVGRALYADAQSYAELRYPQLACEVFLQQGNDHALLFHGSFGFREVGQHVMPGHDIRAAMLMKGLCSYAWVRDTYGDALPGEPWLPQPRALAQASRPTGTCA